MEVGKLVDPLCVITSNSESWINLVISYAWVAYGFLF